MSPPTEIASVTFDFKNIQRTNEGIELSAIPSGVTFTNAIWEVRNQSDNNLVALSHNAVTTIYKSLPIGFYKLVFRAQTATDQYVRIWERAFWMDEPQFTEEEADVVVDLSTGDYYNNFSEADNSGLKIYVKPGTGQLSFAGLFGTPSDYVRVQKAIDIDSIVQTGTGAHAVYLQSNNEYIRFDGFNTDGTNGWEIRGHATNGTQVFVVKDGIFRGIHVMGIDLVHQSNNQAAAFSFIPTTNVSSNATNWVVEDMVVYRCSTLDSGDEGIYMGYNNDALQSGYRPSKFRDAVIARNTINNAGRDGIQPGGCVNLDLHDNTVLVWGLNDDTSHTSAISWNAGNYGRIFGNYMVGGEMLMNIQSGETPFDIEAGQTTPQPLYIYGNVGVCSGGTEPFAIYIQTSSISTSSDNWSVNIFNNTFKSDKPIAEAYFHTGSFTWTGFKMVNNVIVAPTTGGDTYEINYTGGGTQPTGSTVNNQYETAANQADFMFTDYDNNDLTIASLSSQVYSGSPSDIASLFPSIEPHDHLGFPLLSDSYTFGAYSGYEKKTVEPVIDEDPATFSTAVSVEDETADGGTIEFEADKVGILYWVVVANDDTAPSIAQIRAGLNNAGGAAIQSGQILDTGTADTGTITGLSEGVAYDLYAIFVTIDNVEQASATKVDFSTLADVIAPTISDFVIDNTNKDRIYFESSEVITATTYGGFTVATPTKTITAVTINTGELTGHYFTVDTEFSISETPTIAYSGSGSNLQDIATTPNGLASFTATAITNNIAPEAAEPVIGYLNDDITVTGTYSNEFTSTSTAASIESTQIIPSASNGYIQFDWDQDTRNSSSVRIGFIAEADASPAMNDVKLWLALSSANHNIDIYEGGTYKSTYNTFGYNQAGIKYRIIINRSTQKITALASNNDFASSVTLYTSTTNFTGDFRFVFVTTVNGAQAMNCYIQADLGLD
jgi:hypothetical protein